MPYPTQKSCAGPATDRAPVRSQHAGAPLNWDGGEHDRDGHARCAAGLS